MARSLVHPLLETHLIPNCVIHAPTVSSVHVLSTSIRSCTAFAMSPLVFVTVPAIGAIEANRSDHSSPRTPAFPGQDIPYKALLLLLASQVMGTTQHTHPDTEGPRGGAAQILLRRDAQPHRTTVARKIKTTGNNFRHSHQ